MEEVVRLRQEVLAQFGEYLKAESDYYETAEFSHEKFMAVNAAKWRWQQAEQTYYKALMEVVRNGKK
ncbi:MAG: hypothetical protein JST10_03470 [Bacteroidetes bacterium]|nr:hypothetical protein [Bacteroidota bacterium]